MTVCSKQIASCFLLCRLGKSFPKAFIISLVLIALLIKPVCYSSNRNLAAVTVHPLATKASEKAFKDGGNAVDAAVASALTLGVVDGFNSGIGGGCFILIHKPNGEFVAIDGRETAPIKSSRDMYIREGRADSNLSQTGALSIGCLLYTSPSPRDRQKSRMPSSA